MYAQIKKHGENLQNLFCVNGDPVQLCKRLRRLENKAHKFATDYCNGDMDTELWDIVSDKLLKNVNKILPSENADVRIFVNGDARGYALKIEFDDTDARSHEIHRDWGGYGILAPNFSE